jgi:hypothetical protein
MSAYHTLLSLAAVLPAAVSLSLWSSPSKKQLITLTTVHITTQQRKQRTATTAYSNNQYQQPQKTAMDMKSRRFVI